MKDYSNRRLPREKTEKIDETEKRTTAIEKQLEQIDSDVVNVRTTNAVIREMREIEKAERNLMISNVPESCCCCCLPSRLSGSNRRRQTEGLIQLPTR